MELLPMKKMLAMSAAFHLLILALLAAAHDLHWKQTRIKPKVLNVQWVTLPAPEEAKPSAAAPPPKAPSLPEPVKKAPPKGVPPRIKVTELPLPGAKVVLPPKGVQAPPPPATELKAPELQQEAGAAPPVEVPKIEMSPVSLLDPDYADRVRRKIEFNWTPDSFNGANKEVTLSFVIVRNGTVKMPRVLKSSGDAEFDRAAVRAILEVRNFPPLPSDYPNLTLEITCSFRQNKGS